MSNPKSEETLKNSGSSIILDEDGKASDEETKYSELTDSSESFFGEEEMKEEEFITETSKSTDENSESNQKLNEEFFISQGSVAEEKSTKKISEKYSEETLCTEKSDSHDKTTNGTEDIPPKNSGEPLSREKTVSLDKLTEETEKSDATKNAIDDEEFENTAMNDYDLAKESETDKDDEQQERRTESESSKEKSVKRKYMQADDESIDYITENSEFEDTKEIEKIEDEVVNVAPTKSEINDAIMENMDVETEQEIPLPSSADLTPMAYFSGADDLPMKDFRTSVEQKTHPILDYVDRVENVRKYRADKCPCKPIRVETMNAWCVSSDVFWLVLELLKFCQAFDSRRADRLCADHVERLYHRSILFDVERRIDADPDYGVKYPAYPVYPRGISSQAISIVLAAKEELRLEACLRDEKEKISKTCRPIRLTDSEIEANKKFLNKLVMTKPVKKEVIRKRKIPIEILARRVLGWDKNEHLVVEKGKPGYVAMKENTNINGIVSHCDSMGGIGGISKNYWLPILKKKYPPPKGPDYFPYKQFEFKEKVLHPPVVDYSTLQMEADLNNMRERRRQIWEKSANRKRSTLLKGLERRIDYETFIDADKPLNLDEQTRDLPDDPTSLELRNMMAYESARHVAASKAAKILRDAAREARHMATQTYMSCTAECPEVLSKINKEEGPCQMDIFAKERRPADFKWDEFLPGTNNLRADPKDFGSEFANKPDSWQDNLLTLDKVDELLNVGEPLDDSIVLKIWQEKESAFEPANLDPDYTSFENLMEQINTDDERLS